MWRLSTNVIVIDVLLLFWFARSFNFAQSYKIGSKNIFYDRTMSTIEISDEHVHLATASVHTNPDSDPIIVNQPRRWLFFCRSVGKKNFKMTKNTIDSRFFSFLLHSPILCCLLILCKHILINRCVWPGNHIWQRNR